MRLNKLLMVFPFSAIRTGPFRCINPLPGKIYTFFFELFLSNFADQLANKQQYIPEEDVDNIEEPMVDVDSCGEKNSLAVVEYADDTYAYYKKAEVIYIFVQPTL
ncbi:hypothetical protein L1049_026634 [Liquidambar formosana]|uniref:Uncharacterized protein n=1 Tax=Liquidambar formosana TaxID=63359 RepID=A0AAP0NDP0_LIQFO